MSEKAAPFERSEPGPGVRLVTERMPHVRSASIGLWVDVGSRDEPEELAGASHLLEHLLFKGTPSRSARDIAMLFDATGGELNAYSEKEHTCYYARILDADLPMAGEVLLDMFSNALLRSEDLEAERKVVLEELYMSFDLPDERVHDLFGLAVFPHHPLGRPIIGTGETVGAIDRELLARFYRESYRPGRLVVAAAGNVDHEPLAEQLAAGLDGAEHDAVEASGAPGPPQAKAVYEQRTTEQAHLVWGCQSFPRWDPDRYALSVFNALYGGGMSSRLFQEVREERGLAYTIFSGHQMYRDGGVFAVYAGTQESTAATVLEIAREQAAAVAAGELEAGEVERAKGQVQGGLVLSMDDPAGRMVRLGRSELLNKEILTTDEILRRVDGVTEEDVVRVARRLFGNGGLVLASVGPVSDGALDRFVEPL